MFRSIIRPRVFGLGLAALLAVGVIGVIGADGIAVAEGEPGAGDRAGHVHERLIHISVKAVIEASGLDPEVFRAGFAEDKSINTILGEHGVDADAVKAEVLAKAEAAIQAKLDDGTITQEEADRLLDHASQALDRLMEATPGDHDGGPRPLLKFGKGLMASAAETIGIELRELATELRNGKTIAQVASAHSVEPQTVIDNAVAAASAHVDEAVESERITAGQGEELKARLAERIASFVNEGKPDRGERKPKP